MLNCNFLCEFIYFQISAQWASCQSSFDPFLWLFFTAHLPDPFPHSIKISNAHRVKLEIKPKKEDCPFLLEWCIGKKWSCFDKIKRNCIAHASTTNFLESCASVYLTGLALESLEIIIENRESLSRPLKAMEAAALWQSRGCCLPGLFFICLNSTNTVH